MVEKFTALWRKFWNDFIAKQYNKIFKDTVKDESQKWRDILSINLLSIVANTLNNLANIEATFDIESDSILTEPLKDLCKDLEAKRYDIFAETACEGDYYVFPATNERGELYHSYLTQEQVRILDMDGDKITEAYGIIEWYVDSKTNRTYYLLRHHVLDVNGTLTISYYVVDDTNKASSLPQWEHLQDTVLQYANANHIGFGRYKSPVSSRGLSPVYGVPLNYGCAEAEERIFNTLKLMDAEFENGKSVIFTDPRNLLTDEEQKQYKLAENVIPTSRRSGDNSAYIDIFNPTLRRSEFYGKLQLDFTVYEKQIGTSKGVLSDSETSNGATATEVRRINADTIALIGKFHSAIDDGNRMTLEADAVYLNIPLVLWSYVSDWYDPFEDPAAQWQRMLEAHDAGAITTARLTKWVYPNMTDEEVQNELAEISASKQINTDMAIESILNGG
jgi:hypothetical protein